MTILIWVNKDGAGRPEDLPADNFEEIEVEAEKLILPGNEWLPVYTHKTAYHEKGVIKFSKMLSVSEYASGLRIVNDVFETKEKAIEACQRVIREVGGPGIIQRINTCCDFMRAIREKINKKEK